MNIIEAHTLIDDYFHAVRTNSLLDIQKAYAALFNALLDIPTKPQPKEAPDVKMRKT